MKVIIIRVGKKSYQIARQIGELDGVPVYGCLSFPYRPGEVRQRFEEYKRTHSDLQIPWSYIRDPNFSGEKE